MRLALSFLFIFSCVFANTTVDSKIKKNTNTLRQKSQIERKIARQLKDVAQEIISEQKELKEISDEIDRLSISIEKNKNLVKDKEENLEDLSHQNKKLVDTKKKLEEKIVRIIAQDFSFI